MPGRLEVRLLGTVEARVDDRPPPVLAPQLRLLLAALATDAGRVVPMERLIDRVWDSPPARARTSLQVLVARLRRALEGPGAQADVIKHRDGGYLLDVAPDAVDLHRLDELVRQARDAPAAERVELLRQARELWRGEPFPGLPGAWSALSRDVWSRQYLDALVAWARAEQDVGNPAAVVGPLAEAAAHHPLVEPLAAELMRALAAAGRPAEALAAFAVVRRRLADELGADPGPPLQAVHQAILRGESTVPDVTHPPAPDDGPAWTVPALLPPDITDFTGRESTVERLVTVLSGAGEAATPLVVVGVAGMAGIGKTALAVRVAHRAAARYQDGQLYVDLRGVATKPLDPVDALARLLHATGVDSRAVPADPVECAQLYRSRLAGRRVLVVLDNAGSEEQVRALLPGAGTCAVLITSRAPLTGLEGVRWSHLDVFSEADAVGLLGRLAGPGRMAGEADDASAIVRLCGLLPLAVRIAGARLASRPAWPLARLAALLDDEQRRLDRLATGDLAVRASLGLSYGALHTTARRLFRGLGLFDLPDFPARLAAAVLDAPIEPAEVLLEQLVDAQLLADAGTDAAGQSRYRFHDLVRLYARECLEREDPPERRVAVLRAGAGAYLDVAERLAEAIPGPCYAAVHGPAPRTRVAGLADPDDPLSWFDAERAAIAAAVRQLCAAGDTEAAFDLAGCLEKYFDLRGHYLDWRTTNELVLDACRAAGDRRGEAVMLRGLIEIRTWHSNEHPEQVMDHLYADATRLADLFDAVGEERGVADALVEQAWALTARGDYATAAERAERSLRLAERHHHLGGAARAHVAAAVVHGENGLFDVSADHLTSALRLARLLGNARYEATVLQFLGILYTRLGDRAAAEPLLEASLEIVRRYQDRYAEALTLLTLARLHLCEGDPRGRSAAEAALAIGRRYTLPHHIADALGVLGDIDLAAGRYAEAVPGLEESVRLWRTRGWPSFLAEALISLGRAYTGTADVAAARRCWIEARDILAGLGHPDRAGEVEVLLAAEVATPTAT